MRVRYETFAMSLPLFDPRFYEERRNEVRRQAEQFIADRLGGENVISVAESATGALVCTVWYRECDTSTCGAQVQVEDAGTSAQPMQVRFQSFAGPAMWFSFRPINTCRDKIRRQAEQFVNEAVGADNVISVTESVTASGPFMVTVWYRVRGPASKAQ